MTTKFARLMLLSSVVMGGLAACGSEQTAEVKQEISLLEAEDIGRIWQIRMMDNQVRAPFEADKVWYHLVFKRDLQAAVRSLGQTDGMASARAHIEVASMYKMAALLSANSLIETYGKTRQASDPAEVDHLLMVAYVLVGDLPNARKHAVMSGTKSPVVASWSKPWILWLNEDASWPPDLSSLPLEIPDDKSGFWFDLNGDLPHYKLLEQDGSEYKVEHADLGALVVLALWHQRVALGSAKENAAMVDAYASRYRFPVEVAPSASSPIPDELLFGSDLLVAEDGPFLADLAGAEKLAAIDKHASTSLLAVLAKKSMTDGKISSEKAIDISAQLTKELRGSMLEAAGAEDNMHSVFADIGGVGFLRVAGLIAEMQGDRETSGVLQINAMERSSNHTGNPESLLALAAWDASNRYPGRGTEMLHYLIRRYPSLAIARYGLDALALRVSRERVGQGVGM